jgi:methylphosphotriester-DNA--protein-cysteine methyltransferase
MPSMRRARELFVFEARGADVASVERRVRRATGLTRTAIRQVRRAERAVELLSHGASIPETVRRAGCADQAHLTRSLRRFVGQTPTRVLAGRAAWVSFSFKTGPVG